MEPSRLMSEKSPEDRVEIFQEEWNQHTEPSVYHSHHREDLEAHLTSLLMKTDQDWYGPENVIEATEGTVSEIPDSITPRIESASTNSPTCLVEQLEDAAERDRENFEQGSDLQSILSDHVDADGIDEEIEDTDYDNHRIRSTLFAEVADIARTEEKKSLNIYYLRQQIREYRTELDSTNFKQDYRDLLVGPIEQFLREGQIDIPLEEVIPELMGELESEDWDEDSLEEIIDILESPGDIDEFCEVLRGERYTRNYCVPLPADRITVPHMNVAGVEFYMRDCDDFTYLDDLVNHDERTEDIVERSTEGTDFFAVFEVVAPTKEVGEKHMERKLERAIDALNFAKDKGVVQTPFTQPQTSYLCRLPNGRYNVYTSNHRKFAMPHEFQIDEDNVETLENVFDFFADEQSSRTDLENRFIQSYRWYGDGVQSGVREDEFLKYVIAMESMLVPEISGSKKDVLAQRLADLFGIYDEYRDSFKDEVTALYDTRNEIVHNADIDIPDIDQKVGSARSKATQMFGTILENYIEEMDDLNELLDELETLDVPEAPDDFNPFAPS